MNNNHVTPHTGTASAVAQAQLATPGTAGSSQGDGRDLFASPRTPTPGKGGGDGLVAAIEAIEGNINDMALKLEEFKMQNEIYLVGVNDVDNIKKPMSIFQNKLVGNTSVACFVVVSKGKLRIVHCIGKYVAGMMEMCPYDQSLVGVVGDRVKSKDPLAIKLELADMGWFSNKGSFHSELTLRQFFMEKRNCNKFYQVKEDDTVRTVVLPRLLYVPRAHVPWLLEKPRSPWEYHEYILGEVEGAAPDQRPPEIELALTYLQHASVANTSKPEKSVADRSLEPIFQADHPGLDRWIAERLVTTLGPRASVSPPSVVNHYHPPPQQNSGNGGSHQGGDTTTVTGSTDKGALSNTLIAKLKGWCHTLFPHGIPKVWEKLGSTTDVDEQRDFIMKAFEDARVKLGIDEGEYNRIYLDDNTVKDWKKGKFAPGGVILVYESLMKGMSPLLMSTTSAQTRVKIQEGQTVYEDTINTRTEEQATRNNKKAVRAPPRDWDKLKYLINTYAIILLAMYGPLCPHYKSVWILRMAIVQMKEESNLFTSDVCKLLTTHLLMDSRQFFVVDLMPQDFEGKTDTCELLWPESHLAEVARQVAGKRFAALQVAGMPHAWREDKADQAKRPAAEQGSRQTGGPADWRKSPGGGGQYGSRPHNEINHKIRNKMGDLIHDCVEYSGGRFCFRDMLDVGGLRLTQLPRLQRYLDKDGNSTICNAGLIGRCPFNDFTCKFRRVDQRDTPDDFVEEYCRVVRPVLKTCREKFRAHAGNGKGRGGGGGGSRLF